MPVTLRDVRNVLRAPQITGVPQDNLGGIPYAWNAYLPFPVCRRQNAAHPQNVRRSFAVERGQCVVSRPVALDLEAIVHHRQ